jgi:hypothetical protein
LARASLACREDLSPSDGPGLLSSLSSGSSDLTLLTTLWLAASVCRFVAAMLISSPVIFGDELTYWSLARSFHVSGQFLLHNTHSDFPAVLYSILLSPLFGMGDSRTAFALTKLVSSLEWNATVFPAYYLAREIVPRRAALAVAVLSILVPSGIYTATVMSENLFYPIFVLSAWLAFRTLVYGTTGDAISAGVALTLGYFTKPHIFFLVAGYVFCVFLWSLNSFRTRRSVGRGVREELARLFRRCIPLLLLACALLVRVIQAGGQGRSFYVMILGQAYAGIVEGRGTPILKVGFFAKSAMWLLFTFALSTALLPVVAVFAAAFRLPRFTEKQRWFWLFFVCVASISFFLVTRHNLLNDDLLRTHERYVFELSPLLFSWYFASWTRLPRRGLLWATLIVAVVMACAIAYASPHLLTWCNYADSSTLTGLLWTYVLNPNSRGRWLIFAIVLCSGLMSLLGSLSQRRVKLLVLCWGTMLLAFNVGWYGFQLRFVMPDVKRFTDSAMFVKAEISPNDVVGFIEDGADVRVGWYANFWLSQPFYFYRWHQKGEDWISVQLRNGPNGLPDFGEPRPSVLLASDSVALPYPVIHRIDNAHILMYRLPDNRATQ